MKSDSESIIVYVSIAVIVISLFFIGMEVTGYAISDTGLVNVTITSSASIVFTTALLDFGSGVVTPSATAVIDSDGTNTSWSGTAVNSELVLENDGNVNVSFTLLVNNAADAFIGGTTPTFEVKVNNSETNSCTAINANFSSYSSITTSAKLACDNFQFITGADTVNIDVNITINDDAVGAKTSTITATATAV